MDVVVDTSVWVSHFRAANQDLLSLLQQDAVLIHPMIIGEIACGTPPSRSEVLSDLACLRHSQQVLLNEVADFLEREHLYGFGCGIVDMLLLASTLVTPNAKLWTLDKKLSALAERFDVCYRPASIS
jgi:predicted nucleic acid-binding protein